MSRQRRWLLSIVCTHLDYVSDDSWEYVYEYVYSGATSCLNRNRTLFWDEINVIFSCVVCDNEGWCTPIVKTTQQRLISQ